MRPIQAACENDDFRPTEPVDLPEHCPVVIEPELENAERKARSQVRIYEILSHRYDTSDTNAAERHDEHQP
jgi:hypothetical protein